MSKHSISEIRLFKACRRAWELKYIEGLEPVEKADALETGLKYHDIIERVLKGEESFTADEIENNPKEFAMAMAFKDYILPEIKGVQDVEKWFQYNISADSSLIGRVDAMLQDGTVVEHKTTSGDAGGEYYYKLEQDDQIKAYMLGMNTRQIIYTVCKKPTIRQTQKEDAMMFYARCRKWYNEDTEKKISVTVLTRTQQELEEFREELRMIMSEMDCAPFIYRNPAWCHVWGRECEYAPVCQHYDPEQEYVEFTKKERSGK